LKLNITRFDDDDEDEFLQGPPDAPKPEAENESDRGPRKARFILRADGSHRLVLNTPFTKKTKLGGDAAGEKPTGPVLLFLGFLEGQEKPSMLQVKVWFFC
jgi:Ran-binding protein 3